MTLQQINNKIHSQMGRDIIWTFSVQMLVMFCGFIINKILSNWLSVEDFGLFNVIKRSTSVLGFVMLAGTGIAIPRYLPIFRSQKAIFSSISFCQTAFFIVCLVAAILTILCLGTSGTLCSILVGVNDITLLLIALLYAFTQSTASFLYAYFRGTNQFGKFNLSQGVIQVCCILPLLLIPVLTVQKVYVAWCSIMLFLILAFSLSEIRKHHFIYLRRLCISAIRQQFKEAVSYSAPRMIADFFLFSIAAFPIIYLSTYHHLNEVAYFSVGLTFVSLGATLFAFLGYILLPYVSTAVARHEIQQTDRAINRVLLIYLATTSFLILIFYLFTPFLIHLFFATNYLVATDLTRVMLFAILPQSIYLLYRNPIDAISKIPYNTIILGLCLLVMVVSFYLLDTLLDFAIAYLGVSVLQGVLSYAIWKILKKYIN